MSVAYHETFWVVIGTAAPVLVLANIVAASAVFDALLAEMPNVGRRRPTPDGKPPPKRGKNFRTAFRAATAAFVINGALLEGSLWALGTRSDVGPLEVPCVLVLASLALGLFQALKLATARFELRRTLGK